LKVAHSIREAFFAHSQSDYDTLLGPVEPDGAAKLCGHTLHQLAPESLELYRRQDKRAAPFGPHYDYLIIIRVA
jgi:hypothetical protein